MNESDLLQARWLLERRLVPKTVLDATLQQLRSQVSTHTDLCDSLIRQGILDPRTAEQARSATNTPSQSHKSNPRKDARDLPDFPRSGDTFAGLIIEAEIGRGGMGRVYRVHRPNQKQGLALKILAKNNEHDSSAPRFLREVRALIKLNHPNIIRIEDAGEHQGLLYLLMEYVEGQPLSQILDDANHRGGGSPFSPLRLPFLDIARALINAHQQGVIHRDLKPDNIIIEDETHRAVLLDFGLTKPLHQSSQSSEDLTASGTIAGTPAYMAPEQIPGDHPWTISEKTDVWGLAATIYTLCTGIPPFQRPTILATLNAINEARAPSLRSLDPDAPRWLEKTIQKALTKDPHRRPSMQVLARALQDQKAPSNTKNKLLATVIATTALTATLILALTRTTPTTTLLELQSPTPKTVTNKTNILVAGRLDQSNKSILINKQPTTTDHEGRFQLTIKINKNTKRITLIDADSPDLVLATTAITLDTTPPRILLENLKDGVLVANNLDGQVLDQHPASITINGRPLLLDSRGRFSHPLENKRQELVLIARDAAGHTAKLEIESSPPTPAEVLAQQRELKTLEEKFQNQQSTREKALQDRDRRARQAFTELLARNQVAEREQEDWLALTNRRSWTQTAPRIRARVLARIHRLLAPDLVLDDRETDRGAEEGLPGAFRERETGLVLALLPGAMIRETQWASPQDEARIAMLEELGHPLSSLRFLRHVLSYLWYEGLAEACAGLLLADSEDDELRAALASIRAARQEGASTESLNQAEVDLGLTVVRLLEEQGELWVSLKERLRARARAAARTARKLRTERYLPPYLIGCREVPFSVWEALGGAVPQRERERSRALPARRLTAREIEGWLAKRSSKLRMITIAEWRNAIGRDPYPWGEDRSLAASRAWTIERAQRQPRLTREAPQEGLLRDLLGNIEEWADPEWDRWRRAWTPVFGEEQVDSEQNRAMMQTRRLAVGGAFYYPREMARADRPRFQQSDDADLRGFRLARSIFAKP